MNHVRRNFWPPPAGSSRIGGAHGRVAIAVLIIAFAATWSLSAQAASGHLVRGSVTTQGASSRAHGVLRSVSTLSADDAWAVGYTMGQNQRTLVKHWDGTSWTRIPSVNPDPAINFLLGVTAIASDDVWAVGAAGVQGVAQPLIEHWDGTSWSQVPSPRGSDRTSELTSVAAVSANDIWAVGYQDFQFGDAEVILQHWDGSTWSKVDNENPQWLHRQLNGVTALSANNVWAVGWGYQDEELGDLPLSLHWNGTSWRQVPVKYEDREDDYDMQAVVGLSRKDVWMVGDHARGETYGTRVQHFTGKHWQVVDAPSSDETSLYGISAVAPDDIWSVGASGAGTSSFVLHWDGTAWSHVDAPSSGRYTTLYGVDALATDDVWAVGTAGHQPIGSALIEHWDGTAWAIVGAR